MASSYMIGTVLRLTATFRDRDAVLADPVTVTFKVKLPDETVDDKVYGVDSEIVKDSTGIYHWDYEPPDPGAYCWRGQGVGDVDTADEDDFTVDAGCFSE